MATPTSLRRHPRHRLATAAILPLVLVVGAACIPTDEDVPSGAVSDLDATTPDETQVAGATTSSTADTSTTETTATTDGSADDRSSGSDDGEDSTTTSTTEATTTSTTSSTTTETSAATTQTTATPIAVPTGSGCSPGPGALPDGRWYGVVQGASATAVDFDLVCHFRDEQASLAQVEDGLDALVVDDVYTRNNNPRIRVLTVGSDTPISWHPGGDPRPVATTYGEWYTQRNLYGVWVTVSGGQVTQIVEEWGP